MSSLGDEIRQEKSFTSLEEETLLALMRTVDVLTRPAEALFKSHGLSPTQYNALRILRGAGKAGLPCSEIAHCMVTRDPDITRLLDRLERMHLAKRARDAGDRRVVVARITAAGLELLDKLDVPVAELNRKLLGEMGEERLRTLLALLQQARGSI
jgi:MarR family transcriptional regulator, organic hydroperoxide resistance regulator